MNEVLTDEQRELTNRVYRNGTTHEKFVVGWCLENIIPLRKPETANCVRITYEEPVANPTETFKLLADRLQLDETDKLLDRTRVPSRTAGSTPSDRLKGIKTGNSEFLLNEWNQRIGKSEASDLFRILSVFDIDIYREAGTQSGDSS